MKVIPLKFGAMFKQAFSHPDVFNRFVEDVLDISFHTDTVHTEYEYPEPIGFVRSTYDLFAKDENNRIIVEIQHIKEDDFFDRFLYYHLISLVEQVGGYDEYRFKQTVYTIVVLTSTPRDGSVNFSCAVSNMNPTDEYGKTIDLYPHRLVFLCPRQVNEQTPQKIRQWLNFIEDSLDGEMDINHYPHKIWQTIMTLIKKRDIDPAVLAKIKDEAAWEKAKKRFVAEGKLDGKREGKLETQQELAKKMLNKGLELALIADITAAIQSISSHPLKSIC